MASLSKSATRTILSAIALCVVVAIALTVAFFWHHPPRSFRVVSQDGVGGGGLGPGKRGLGCSMKTWKSSDGIEIQENEVGYRTADDARADFGDQLRLAKQIYARTENRIVGSFENSSFQGGATIATLKGDTIHFVDARSLDAALTIRERNFGTAIRAM